MASVKQKPRKDGSICYEISVCLGRDAKGKLKLKTTTFYPKSKISDKAKKEAEAFAAVYEQQVKNGDIVSGDKLSFAGMEKLWEENWLPAKTPVVQENYKRIMRNHILPALGRLKLKDIKAIHIDKILKQKQTMEGKAAKTIKMIFTVVNSVFTYAVKKDYLKENPCRRCDALPPVEMKTGDDLCFFDEDQTKRFLNDALTMEYQIHYGERRRKDKKTGKEYTVAAYTVPRKVSTMWRLYFNMAIHTTMRRGEMCALTWQDIDLDAQIISITKALAAIKGQQYLKEPKTKAGIRSIYISASLVALLKQWKQEQLQLCMKLGTAWKGHRNGLKEDGKTPDSFDENYIFIQDKDIGLPLNLSTPDHKFHEILDMYNATREKEEEKLPHITLHDLRHTGATLLLGKNTDIETVSKRLGHSKTSITLDIYGHALPENDRIAADTLEAMLI